ncbi:MAG: flagellar export chaperone FliS [Halioglobus sp.]
MNEAAMKQYQSVGVQTGVQSASPHQLISMLFSGAIDRISAAKGAIERDEVGRKGELIGRAIEIIDNLRAALDHEKGGDISASLVSLYDYMEQTLVEANLDSDLVKLGEVGALLTEIQTAWDDIPLEQRVMPA